MTLARIDWKPDGRKLRQFGLVGMAVFLALAAWAIFRGTIFGLALGEGAARWTAGALGALAVFCCGASALSPRALLPLYLALTAIGLPIGWVVSHVVLALVFYGLVTPMGLVMRLLGRDPMNRRFDRTASSYWTPRAQVTDPSRYFKQY